MGATHFDELKERDERYIMHTYARYQVSIARGKNATCYDHDGRELIDFTSGIGVNCLGFADEGWVAAVSRQLAAVQHISNLFYTAPCVDQAQMLCERTGMARVFFANSGAEANEGAIKAARKYSFDKYGEGRNRIVTLSNSFHGRTVTTLSATGQESFHRFFFPFTEGFVYAETGNLDDTLAKLDSTVCAVMLELVQGEGGVVALDRDYVAAVARACAERDILVILDEVQTGVGRTGSLYGFMQYGISPDIVTSAKGLGGGLPIGAILFNAKTADASLGAGDHGSTFGGNPAVCAGAVEVLKRMTDEFLAEVKCKGDYMRQQILAMPHVKSVSGMGMMIGVELDGLKASDVVAAGLEKGVMLLTAKTRVRLLPPLTITYGEIDRGLKAMAAVLAEAE
ncbi:MAG: Acetylornithine aminotransferase [Firmicutes bacterium ADurb.Bin506]|nr:MAG: Acetylornithine aminotransferase [Firmicutes bacterium ADurb.Bin506]